MSKAPYRAQQIKEVELDSLAERFRGTTVTVGVDIAKEMIFACLMGLHYATYKIVKFNLRSELGTFVALLRSLETTRVQVVFEPSGSYGDPLRAALEAERDIDVFKMRPHKVKVAQELFDDVPSLHDGKAAWLLARLHLHEVSEEWRTMSEEHRTVRVRLDELNRREKARGPIIGNLESWLGRHWPEVTQYLKLTSVTLLRLLEEYGSPRAIASNYGSAAAFMRKVGGHMLSEEKIAAVLESARTTHGVVPIEAERDQVSALAHDLLRLHKEIGEYSKLLKKACDDDVTVSNAKGFGGVRLACALLVMLGVPGEYESAAQFEKGAGLNLKERSSGRHVGQLRITKRGPRLVRKYLYLFALRMIQQRRGCPYCRQWYLRRLELNGGCRIKAVTAVMRKLLKALYHVAQGAEYDPHKLFDTKRLPLAS